MASGFEWRCIRRVGAWGWDTLGVGQTADYAEALRAAERAAGWDRLQSPSPPATADREAIISVRPVGGSRWTVMAVW